MKHPNNLDFSEGGGPKRIPHGRATQDPELPEPPQARSMQRMGMPRGQQCDCCEKKASRVMNSTTTEWCADWFIGYYCDECFAGVEAVMKEERLR